MPLTFAYQQQQITDQQTQIRQLNDQLEADRKTEADKDAQVAQLQKQIAAAAEEPAPATPVPAIAAAAGAGAPGTVGAPTTTVPDSVRLSAQQWAAMDPQHAAALVQKLPTSYVSAVFAQMSPDAVGPIMDALPPKVAALIVENGTNTQISAPQSR
jgi:hypothetical protein